MTRAYRSRRVAALALAAAGAAVTIVVAFGLASGGYVVDPSSVAGGGGRSTGGDYAVQGVIGQPFAGTVQGSGFVLTNGVIPGSAANDIPSFRLFLPAVVSNP